ncbi:MAG: sigma-70 family RNA polymerase sigma factor [Anaerolineales bacterium]|nr:sigma-70 family RNA polymerase sigma factor [Anaerolineales bacterium]
MLPENELLQRARRFDRPALAEAYDRYSPALYRYALRRLGDPELAEECVAETFSRLLQALRHERGPRDHLQAYLYRTAHNWIVDHYRRQPPAPLALDDDLPGQEETPEEAARRHLRQGHLRQALQELTPDQQQVISLKYLEGWENEAIARVLARPVGAVKSLQHRALAHLQRLLKDEDLI